MPICCHVDKSGDERIDLTGRWEWWWHECIKGGSWTHAKTHEKFFSDGGWQDKEKDKNSFKKWDQMDPVTIMYCSRHKWWFPPQYLVVNPVIFRVVPRFRNFQSCQNTNVNFSGNLAKFPTPKQNPNGDTLIGKLYMTYQGKIRGVRTSSYPNIHEICHYTSYQWSDLDHTALLVV